MNVYSVRLIPRLKIKFCEFFGMATSMAMEQLFERIQGLERKMDRFDHQLRRMHRRQIVLAAQTTVSARVVAKKKKLSPLTPAKTNVTHLSAVTSEKKGPRDVAKSKAVVLMGTDEPTRENIRTYFGKGVELLDLENPSEILPQTEGKEMKGIFFDRTLLGEPGARLALEQVKIKSPQTPFVGLSNYLTLSLARALPGTEDFATFLTKPVTVASLTEVFAKGSEGAKAISYKD